MTRSKKRLVVALVVTALVLVYISVCYVHETPAFQNPKYSKAVGEYGGKLGFYFGGGEAYAIGANSVGDPVFKDPEKAFHQATADYKEGFKEIQKQKHFFPICSLNWRDYGTYGWQTSTSDRKIQSQCVHISQFFDIYENSFG